MMNLLMDDGLLLVCLFHAIIFPQLAKLRVKHQLKTEFVNSLDWIMMPLFNMIVLLEYSYD